MQRCENCQVCGLTITFDPAIAGWGPPVRVWRSTCTNRAVAEADDGRQTDCLQFNRTLATLIY